MAWVEVHEELPDHPKVIALAKALDVKDHDCVWPKLIRLWHWCLTHRPDGNLSGLTARKIASVSNWDGDPDQWVTELSRNGWIDDTGHIHDAEQYFGRWRKIKAGNRKRKQKQRHREREVTRDSAVTVTGTPRPRPRPKPDLDQDSKNESVLAKSTSRVTSRYKKEWGAAFGSAPDVTPKDIEVARELATDHPFDEIAPALHHYCSHFEGFWGRKGAPLRGLKSSWQEVATSRIGLSIAPLGGVSVLETCGCVGQDDGGGEK